MTHHSPDNPQLENREGSFERLIAAQKREAKHIVAELLAMRGLMPLLMKPRNGSYWTAAEKAELLLQLRRLSRLSPYLLFLLLPGSALLLPMYAWWLDRRRGLKPAEMSKSADSDLAPESLRP